MDICVMMARAFAEKHAMTPSASIMYPVHAHVTNIPVWRKKDNAPHVSTFAKGSLGNISVNPLRNM
jgi:hypothetical protein